MFGLNELLNKTLVFAKYNNKTRIFTEELFNNKIKSESHPLNEDLYWKIYRGCDSMPPSWFKGRCPYSSFQHTIITQEGSPFELNVSSFIGGRYYSLDNEEVALFLAMKDYSTFISKTNEFLGKKLSPFCSNLIFDNGIPSLVSENKSIFNKSLRGFINKNESDFDFYNKLYNQAKNNDKFCFITEPNTEINPLAEYFIFDFRNASSFSKNDFSSIIHKIINGKNENFYLGIIGGNDVKTFFSGVLTDINNSE